MAGLFFGGIGFIICIVIALVVGVIGFFIGNVLLFDSIALSIIAGATAANYLAIHPAFSLLIGIATFFLFHIISRTSIGFWLISIAVSVFLAFIIAAIVWSSTGKDPIWSRVSWGIAFVVIVGLHIKARDN